MAKDETKLVSAIVRGPEPYFDGTSLHPAKSVVLVDPKYVSDEDTYEEEVEVRLAQPISDGKGGVIRVAKETVRKRVKFRPLGSEATIAEPQTTAQVATGPQADRLNVDDFLKQGVKEIENAIVSGSVDDHLGVIEQAEIARKGPTRKDVAAAIAARRASLAG